MVLHAQKEQREEERWSMCDRPVALLLMINARGEPRDSKPLVASLPLFDGVGARKERKRNMRSKRWKKKKGVVVVPGGAICSIVQEEMVKAD